MEVGQGIEEAWWQVLEDPSEEKRSFLARLLVGRTETLLDVVSRRVAGELVPDTVVAGRAVEIVVAALALRRSSGVSRPLRLVLPRDPVPGWAPLLMAAEDLAVKGLVEVYRLPWHASHKPTAREVYRRAIRVFKGFSAGVVDISDASPLLAVAAYSAARYLTVAVHLGHALVFQKV